MALRPPLSALTSASSARAPASLHWASRSFLFFSTSLTISSLQQCTALFKCILHSCSLAISCNLSISSSRFCCRFFINLDLGISDLQLILLDCVLSLGNASNCMLQCQGKISSISFELLLHSQGFCLALSFGLQGRLHGVQCLCLVFPDHSEFLILFSNAAVNLNLNLS